LGKKRTVFKIKTNFTPTIKKLNNLLNKSGLKTDCKMLGKFITKEGSIYVLGRSVKNKPSEQLYINIGTGKIKYIRTLLKSYRSIGYNEFNIVELSELSLTEWKYRKYPVPKGYEVRYNKSGAILGNNGGTTNRNFRKIDALKSNQSVKNL